MADLVTIKKCWKDGGGVNDRRSTLLHRRCWTEPPCWPMRATVWSRTPTTLRTPLNPNAVNSNRSVGMWAASWGPRRTTSSKPWSCTTVWRGYEQYMHAYAWPCLFLFNESSLWILCQASKWVDDGIYLLASQPVDKCLSHDGAELALQELERYLDNAGQNQLTDPSTIWTEYEAVLNQQFRVRRLT